MRTLLLIAAVAIHPFTVVAQSTATPKTLAGDELEVPVRKARAVVRPATAASAPDPVGQIQTGATFRAGDSFELRMSGMPQEDAAQFSQPFTIGADGSISVPLAGQIPAAGLTQSQLERAIERKLVGEEIFRFPTATINVGNRFVTVGGQVRQANRLPWSSDLTLLTAISAVGGGNDFARDGVELIRDKKVSVFSIRRLRKDPSQDPQLFPGDRIEQR